MASLLAAPTGIALFDPVQRLRQANAAFLDCFAVSLEEEPSWETILRTCHAARRGLFVDTDDIESWLASERRSHRQAPARSWGAQLVDGRRVWISESLQTDGWLLMVISDVSAMQPVDPAESRASLAPPLSVADALTGLPNRRQIFQRLEALVSTTRELRVPLSLAVLEIDHLATLAERHGTETTNRILEHFAGQLRRHLRPKDEAGRIGDGDFLLLLPNTTVDGADEALSRLRTELQAAVAVREADVPAYCFSAGVAPLLAGDTASEVFTRADGALYRAKDRGRGCQELVTAEQLGAVAAPSVAAFPQHG